MKKNGSGMKPVYKQKTQAQTIDIEISGSGSG